tara:strand:+ start:150 stop:257 length:108 start_codon:yes stop_codon:yes gene_type:complete
MVIQFHHGDAVLGLLFEEPLEVLTAIQLNTRVVVQ